MKFVTMPATALRIGLLGLVLSACGPVEEIDDRDPDGEKKVVAGLDARPSPGACVPREDPPERLSETGCFAGTPPVPTPGLIPYDVAAPLWSDGTGKGRWVAIPEEGKLKALPDGRIDFPPGTVFIKDFVKDDHRLETRFLVRKHDASFAAYTYAWSDDQLDAFLVGSNGTTIDWEGGIWSVPSEAQCFACHRTVSGVVLGPEIAQLNNDRLYEATGRTANQLVTWDSIGLFEPRLDDPETLPAFPALDDESASIESRARAYLHSNCANCHRPGGPMAMDLRASRKMQYMSVCDVHAENSAPTNVPNPRLVVPGEPEESALLLRMATTDFAWRMPPMGTKELDEQGIALVSAWIRSLTSCE